MKKKLVSLLCAAALAVSLTACSAKTETTADSADSAAQASESDAADGSTTASAAESADAGEEETASLHFSDDGITVQSGSTDGCEIDGTALTISAAGTYRLSGSCTNGSVTVEKEVTDVTLLLDALSLSSTETAPILCKKSSEVCILAADASESTLSDAAANNTDANPDNAENAVICCKDSSQVTLCGTGALTILANGKNGISSGDDASLTIQELALSITAPVNDAINAKNLLDLESGTLVISAADDAVHCDYTLNVGMDGTDGPIIQITDCCEGLEAAELNICSGTITIQSTDDCLNAANSDLGSYAFSINISGGTITAVSSDGDGFDSNGSMTISGGTVVVWTANTADNQPLDADAAITISGGTVLAAGNGSGMGMNLSCTQYCLSFGGASSMDAAQSGTALTLPAGSTLAIQNAAGDTIWSNEALTSARDVFFSSPDLVAGESYSLLSADSILASAEAAASKSRFGGMGDMQQPGGMQQPGDMQPGKQPDGSAAPQPGSLPQKPADTQ